jgi:predicted lactoylglutathione lyase
VENAVSVGGKGLHKPQKAGNIYGLSFVDLDNHQWNVFYIVGG